MSRAIKNYYQLLGIDKNASAVEIKKAYRRLALQYHPDKSAFTDAHGRFTEINEAYQVLSDPHKRQQYDYIYDRYILGLYSPPPAQPQYRTNPTPPRPRPQTRPQSGTRPRYARPRYYNAKHAALESYELPAWLNLAGTTFLSFCLGFTLLLFIDYFLPYQAKKEPVLYVAYEYSGSNVTFQIQTPTYMILSDYPASKHSTATIISTPLLNIVKEYILPYKAEVVSVSPAISIYEKFLFLPLAIFVSSLIGLIKRKKGDAIIKASVSCILLGLIMVAIIW